MKLGQITINPLDPEEKPLTLDHKSASRLIQYLGHYYIHDEDSLEEITVDGLRQILAETIEEGDEDGAEQICRHLETLKDTDKFMLFQLDPNDPGRLFSNATLLGSFATKEEIIDLQQTIKFHLIVSIFKQLTEEQIKTMQEEVKPQTDHEMKFIKKYVL